jgi:hypothetical protein
MNSQLALLVSICLSMFLSNPWVTYSGTKVKINSSQDNYTIYMPFAYHQASTRNVIPNPHFGVGLSSFDEGARIRDVEETNIGYIYNLDYAIKWSDFEPDRAGQYDPSDPNAGGERMRLIEQQIINANARQLRVIQTIYFAPKWAIPKDKTECAPILPEYYDAFALFVEKIVKKYSQSPYNIKYWEIWDQPDRYTDMATRTKPYSCSWANFKLTNDYGGYEFGKMLRLVGQSIRKADPNAKIISGSLEMDCEPTYGDVDEELTRICTTGKFLTGMWKSVYDVVDYLAIDAADKYDGVFDNKIGHYFNHVFWHTSWKESGPTIIPQARWVRAIIEQAVPNSNKPIINKRSALRCKFQNFNWKYAPCETTYENFDITKSYYVAQVNTVSLANNIALTFWDTKTENKGDQTELFDERGSKAFQAWRTNMSQLRNVTYKREIKTSPFIKIYEFSRDDVKLQVMWAITDNAQSINFDQPIVSIFDVYGNQISATQSISVTVMPLYVHQIGN